MFDEGCGVVVCCGGVVIVVEGCGSGCCGGGKGLIFILWKN